ncbi:adenosylcobinamide amidohydrolase [Saccharopolyspora rectivirgula]|uniref:adenosylcobinamide amidohydrolase n=1 Tax=Saccharopolyspora rectivirgula TaxID=28042 RepID=UPI00041536B2|nr:adenosylcobinamide amidohydrolase [Saccharopolyspora rectivirgula]
MNFPEPALADVGGWPLLVWRCSTPWLAISSAPHGGGLGERSWVFNATVHRDYDNPDPDAHAAEIAGELGLTGTGIGLLTAVDVRHEVTAVERGVRVSVTTGVSHPIWAAEPAGEAAEQAYRPGTINAVCWLPVRLTEAALVNTIATVAEAKAQAVLEAGCSGTGTVTDATAVLCPVNGPAEPYGGPRSKVGAVLARAVHAAVAAGLHTGGQTADR